LHIKTNIFHIAAGRKCMSRARSNKATRVMKIYWNALQFQIAQFALNLRKSLICDGIAVRGLGQIA